MQSTTTVDRDTAAEISQAFAEIKEGQEIAPYRPQSFGTNIVASDGVITAQRVDVERSIPKVMSNLKAYAAAAGEEWGYRYPVRDNRNNRTTWIEGPSIKCANAVAREYGNCKLDVRVIDGPDAWMIYAQFIDWETGFSYARPFQQRKGQQSLGTRDAGRALDIALSIGVSKAIRNVVCNALETFTTFAWEESRKNMVERIGKELDRYRTRVVSRLAEMQIEVRRVEAVIGRAPKDWLAPDVALIIAQIQSIQDGMATVDETWPGETTRGQPRPTRQQPPQDEESQPGAQDTGDAGGVTNDGHGNQQPVVEGEPEPYFLLSPEGEDLEFPTAKDAAAALMEWIEDAGKRRGHDSAKTIWEDNGAFLAVLRQRDHGEMADQLVSMVGAGLEQLAAPKEVAAASPASALQETQKAPPAAAARSPIWGRDSFAVEVPVKADRSINFPVLRDVLTTHIAQATTAAELDKFEVDNTLNVRKLKEAYPSYATLVDATVAAQRDKIKESE